MLIKHDSDGDTNYNWCPRNDPRWLGKGISWAENQRMNRDHPNYSITKFGQITKNNPEEFYCQSVSSERPSANACVKNLKK